MTSSFFLVISRIPLVILIFDDSSSHMIFLNVRRPLLFQDDFFL